MNQYNDFIEDMLCGIRERNVLVDEYKELCLSNKCDVDVDVDVDVELEDKVFSNFDKISDTMSKLEKKSLWIYDTLYKDNTLVSNFNLLYELLEGEEFEKCAVVRNDINTVLKKKKL